MSATDFLDSNVLLYLPTSDIAKAEKAAALLANGGTVSIQVLNEFASVALRKLGRTMAEVRAALANIRAICTVIATDLATHDLGLDIAERYKFSIHDSMLLAAALKAGCRIFYSEDLQHGQKIDSLTIRNPFRM
ncbi:MAG TPA: PIN domain-containing protein [Rhizomicrobium sp.]|jgi:predicted nucleic acid-binding protein